MEYIILDFIQNYLSFSIFDLIFKIITYSGNVGFIFILISIILIINKKTRKIGICCLVSLIIGALITNACLKPLVNRVRPYEFSDVILKIAKPIDSSFPSGHTTAGFALAFVLWKEKFTYNSKKIYLYIFIYSSLVSYSRMYFYVHYPTDVLVGIIVGYVSSLLSKLIVDKYYKNKLEKNFKKS